MLIHIICQPGAEQTHWCALYLKGAHSEAKRKGYTLALLSPEDALAQFKTKKPVCAAILSTSRSWTATAAEPLRTNFLKLNSKPSENSSTTMPNCAQNSMFSAVDTDGREVKFGPAKKPATI